MPSLTEAAIELARAGWPVFPVSADQKRPRTPHGHLDATTQEYQIRKWTALFNQGGGIATPTGNGLLVIDVDPRNGGTVPRWAPETLTANTQSGGIHLYYKITPEDIRSRASLFGPGVDSKCGGGYVLVPPTPGYTWANTQARVTLTTDDVRTKFNQAYVSGESRARLAPEQWRRGIIHDQVMAWAAYFAGQLNPDDVPTAVWALVDQARASGVRIDNSRNHIGTAISWAVRREATSAANNQAMQAPNLG
jgi:hypothetical protein